MMDGSSDSDGDHAGEELLSQRATLDVGRRLPLRALGGACIGDDVSWKGSKVTRFALLQTAGSRGSLVEWGRWWGQALADLGTDIGILSETRLWLAPAQDQAVRGLLEAGYQAVSHNVEPPALPTRGAAGGPTDPRASGILIAVRRDFTGAWRDVERDMAGRGLAGNVILGDGMTVRVVGLYGLTGACSPSFAHY